MSREIYISIWRRLGVSLRETRYHPQEIWDEKKKMDFERTADENFTPCRISLPERGLVLRQV